MTDKLTFTDAYLELQTLTKEFETGDLDLEKAIPKFKRAAELAKFLKKHLTKLESQVEEINLDLQKDDEIVPENNDDITF